MLYDEDVITGKVAEIIDHRAVIEQAKGMLMLIYNVDADTAFEVLKWRSQVRNVKLRRLAEEFIEEFRTECGHAVSSREPFDSVVLRRSTTATGDGAEVLPSLAN